MNITFVECTCVNKQVDVRATSSDVYVDEVQPTSWNDKVGQSVTKPLYQDHSGFVKSLKEEIYNLNKINDQLKSFNLHSFDKTKYLDQIRMNRI